MNLFLCLAAKPEAVPAPTALPTPLGRVQLEAIFGGRKITDEMPFPTYALSSGGWLVCWHRQDFDLELLVCRPLFRAFSDPPLTDCWAGLWRLRAKATIDSCLLTAAWEDGYTWKDGGPNSGQWQYTKTWNDGQTEVSIGTEDGDTLAVRSHRGDGLPSEWEPFFRSTANRFDWFSLQMVHYEVGNRGIPIPLPPLKAGQQCQIHFVVAWSPEESRSSYFGVERAVSEILAGAGCS